MAKDKDPYGPVRKQDPYVTGRRDGGSYKQGGEVQSGTGGGGDGDKDESCFGMVAKLPELVIAIFSPTKRREMRERASLAWAQQVANDGFPPHGHHLRGLDY